MASLDSVTRPNNVSAEVDPTTNAARVSYRPLDHVAPGRILGHYSATVAWEVGVFPNPTGGAFGCRFADPNAIAVVYRVWVSWNTTALGNNGGGPWLNQLFVARGYTSPETTNVSFANFKGANNSVRDGMGTSLMSMFAANLYPGYTGGTRTLDPLPIIQTFSSPNIAAGGSLANGGSQDECFKWDMLGGHPLVLGYNEGLYSPQTGEGYGSSRATFGMSWAEVAAF